MCRLNCNTIIVEKEEEREKNSRLTLKEREVIQYLLKIICKLLIL